MPKRKTAAERRAARIEAEELRFAAIYIAQGRNGTRAWNVLHPNARPNSCASSASEWLRRPKVLDEIGRLTNEAWKREQMGADETLGRMARIAKQNIREYYWQLEEVGTTKRAGGVVDAGEVGDRKPLCELTEAQTECIKGFKFSPEGLVIQEHYAKDAQLLNMAKHHKLMTDRVDVNLTMPLDKMIEASYGENKEKT